jgi:hypothetical protein
VYLRIFAAKFEKGHGVVSWLSATPSLQGVPQGYLLRGAPNGDLQQNIG